ncbi:MAG TPA: PepSY-associated TM helix domain-containing protein, partial [Caulobacteraceae bacterium]|nr:PepSY-associated TM helix domain-containing protein [Caulobacteraceae bacterium]
GVGRKVVGWLGWAMTISCLTGLWLWWPRNGKVLKALRWKRSPSFLNNLHHMFGFWILVPLLVVSLTGVYISFPQTARALFGVAEAGGPPRPPRPPSPPPLTAPRLGPDEAVAAALRDHPDSRLAVLQTPTQGEAPQWRVELTGEDGGANLAVSDATAEVSAAPPASPGNRRDPISRLMRQVHDGADTPVVWQVLVFLTGLAPLILGTSGTVMWLRRRRRRRLIRHAHDQAAAQTS